MSSKIYIPYSTWIEGDGYVAHQPYGNVFFTDRDKAIESLREKALYDYRIYDNVTFSEHDTIVPSKYENVTSVYAFMVTYTYNGGERSRGETYYVKEYDLAQ